MKTVTIVMLNWNGWEHTVESLDSLLRLDYPSYKILLVDNNSDDDEGNRLRQKYNGRVEVLINNKNVGFCGGNNVGIRHALRHGTDYVLLINNDVEVEPNFLQELVNILNENPDIGVVGPKIVLYYYRTSLDSIGGHVNFWTATGKLYKKSYTNVRSDLNFVSGCCMLLRKDVFEDIGFFNEDYFSYWEETDLCLRAKKAGWQIACNPHSVIYHKVGKANKYLSNKYIYYMLRNSILCMRQNGRWYQWPSFIVLFFLKFFAGYTAYLMIKRPRSLFVPWLAIFDFSTGRFGKREGL